MHPQQQQQPTAYPMGTATPAGNPTGSAGSSAFLSGDAWKQQTSRFASAMANMAQRAAHQVATVAQQPPTSGGSAASFGSNSAVVSGMGAPATTQPGVNGGVSGLLPGGKPILSTNATAMIMGQQPQPQPQQQPPGSAAAMAMQNAAALDNEQKAALIKSHVGDLLPGERIIMFVANLMHVSDSTGFSYTYAQQQPGSDSDAIWCCAMTYYRLILFGTGKFTPPPRPADWNPACWPSRPVHVLQMPLASMERVEKSVFSASLAAAPMGITTNTISTTSLMGLQIVGKDNGRSLRFTTPSYADTARAHEALQTYAFPGRRNLGYLFAFESKKDDVMKSIETDSAGNKRVTLEPSRKRFDPLVEFTRQFQKCTTGESQTCPWSIYQSINQSYQLCNSYPAILAGPASVEDTNPDGQRVLQQSASFRSEQRLPMLSFAAGNGGGSIWRCSQPKIGLQGNRNSADEWLLNQILEQAAKANAMNHHAQQVIPQQILMQLTGSPTLEHLQNNWLPQTASGTCELKILDLRPRSSAMANRTGGYGYENTSNYPGTTLQFCGIGNIHAVRDAYQKMSNVCTGVSTQDMQWTQLIEDSKWLSMTRLILSAAWETAYWVHAFHTPILLHCSHGWDRTSQVACVAQLLLDPYYRTMEGFACLVEKDFMAFGHPFHTRCAHGVGGSGNNGAGNNMSNANGDVDEGQISPIFMQFLDCVYQLIELYPEAFEINTRYLLDLSDHVYSCRFGNFLCDTERERETVAGIRQRTHSVWDFLEARHGGDTFKAQSVAKGGVLLMPLPTLMRNISLWTDRHAKHGPKPTQRWLPTLLPTVQIPPDVGRHDDDTPEFHRMPTLQESQTQILAPAASSIEPLSSEFSIGDGDDA
mmetsp:Transcript_4670/g.13054  ORF Transcript_4670/g.13054 Transcript_4670/m.13054 type:complete len:873 (-) Transcript_4670:49-2667(-)